MIKGVNKGSVVIVWDREVYIKEAENQLGNTNIYEEVLNDVKPFLNMILYTLEKVRKRGEVCTETLNSFLIKDAKFPFTANCQKSQIIYKRYY